MIWNDLLLVLQWWLTWAAIGLVGWPLTRILFKKWSDQGYIFAKAIGAFGITFGVFVLTVTKIAPFSQITIFIAGLILATVGILGHRRLNKDSVPVRWRVIFAQEIMFLFLLVGWAFVKGHEPTINGLEKFMDYGITRSILQSTYMPPADMWYAGGTVNYYYFGHLMMAVTTRLSGLELGYTFNLMLATIFAICFCSSFAIGKRLTKKTIAALFIAYLVTMAGNLHTIYAFTSGYAGQEDNPPGFWTILTNPLNVQARKFAWDNYWYPNATRFIPYTIHEFPSYSFVVSDLHGHVLSIPLALIAIAFLIDRFVVERKTPQKYEALFFGWILGMLFMTNALDGPIYFGLFGLLLLTVQKDWKKIAILAGIAGMIFVITASGFLAHFKSFVTGVAVNCPPANLVNIKIGPILFETAEKCQHSPIWMILVLWGFFFYSCTALIVGLFKSKSQMFKSIAIIFVYCVGLILFAEVFYFKDIYPQHFRSNTMFKLGYQAFMMLAIVSGYGIVQILKTKGIWFKKLIFSIGLLPLLFLVVIYPLFSVKSYFGKMNISSYKTLYGLNWIQERYPDNAEAITWLQGHTVGHQPVILEANGDSYTDYDMFSTFTGLPTIAGWTVHEWLWRDGYEPIANRAEEVRQVYEAQDSEMARAILKKYNVTYLIVGTLEREKYQAINEILLASLGQKVFERPTVSVYKVQ